MNYNTALEELQQIVQEIEQENVPVDQLAEKVRKASKLIEYCQTQLKGADAEVRKILDQLETKEEE